MGGITTYESVKSLFKGSVSVSQKHSLKFTGTGSLCVHVHVLYVLLGVWRMDPCWWAVDSSAKAREPVWLLHWTCKFYLQRDGEVSWISIKLCFSPLIISSAPKQSHGRDGSLKELHAVKTVKILYIMLNLLFHLDKLTVLMRLYKKRVSSIKDWAAHVSRVHE